MWLFTGFPASPSKLPHRAPARFSRSQANAKLHRRSPGHNHSERGGRGAFCRRHTLTRQRFEGIADTDAKKGPPPCRPLVRNHPKHVSIVAFHTARAAIGLKKIFELPARQGQSTDVWEPPILAIMWCSLQTMPDDVKVSDSKRAISLRHYSGRRAKFRRSLDTVRPYPCAGPTDYFLGI